MIKNINFLRFLFSLIIIYFHIMYDNLTFMYSCHPPLDGMRYNAKNSFIAVDFFLIMAGYFFFKTYEETKQTSVADFALGKFIRLYPAFAVSILCSACFHFFQDGVPFFTECVKLLFLSCTGLTNSCQGIDWFVPPFFFSLVFYFAFLKNVKENKANILILILVCFYFNLLGSIEFFNSTEKLDSFKILSRVFGGIGLGYLLGVFVKNSKNKNSLRKGVVLKIFATLIEIFCISFLIYNMVFYNNEDMNKIVFILVFLVLFYCFIQNQGYLSNLFNIDFFAVLGKYTYSIYIMQQFSFYILSVTLWKYNRLVIDYARLNIFLSLAMCCVIGALTYHFVENPLINLYKKQKKLLSKES